MAKLKRGFLFAAFVFSGIAAALSAISLITQQWVVAELKFIGKIGVQRTSTVKYGLFAGVFCVAFDGSSTAYVVTMTCSYMDNICALLCKHSELEREEELRKLKKNYPVQFDPGCPQVPRTQGVPQFFISQLQHAENEKKQRTFLNAGYYLSTLIFLSLSILMGTVGAGVAAWNVMKNPKEWIFSTQSLFYYNLFACLSALLVVILWGAHYATIIVHNVGLLMSITNLVQHYRDPMLGFSYWLNFVSMLLYCLSFLMLYVRKFLIANMATSNYI